MKVIITGTTGMVGEGVLLECLEHSLVTEILSVSRRPTGISHPKLKECIVPDFLALQPDDERLMGYDACFFCAGVSSVGMDPEQYRRIAYDTTLAFAKALHPNPNLSFVYVSGGGTDSTGTSRMKWARVKGQTENDLMQLPFRQAFGFRPGFMRIAQGQRHVPKFYGWVSWLFPLLNLLAPGQVLSMRQVAGAMIEAARNGYEKNIIDVKDICLLAEQDMRAEARR